jgi:hypothetical protein
MLSLPQVCQIVSKTNRLIGKVIKKTSVYQRFQTVDKLEKTSLPAVFFVLK